MTKDKNKNKKTTTEKHEKKHTIPHAKTARGRRPHTEMIEDEAPYQPSLLTEIDSSEANSLVDNNLKTEASVHDQSTSNLQKNSVASEDANINKEEIIIEGQPAPESKRTKVDLRDHLENVVGVVQMGTALVKSSFPKPFEFAEKIVEDWKQDGDFSELPISQPLVQFYLGLGLRKAKQTERDLEQKLENAGVLPVFRKQWQKAQKLFK